MAVVCAARAQPVTPTHAIEAAARREAAIVAAREGDHDAALTTLRALQRDIPEDLATLHDLVTVLAWAEHDSEAVALAAPLSPADAPRYVQLAVAKSARNVQRFDLAAVWYDAALAADHDDPDALAGRLLTAGDARDAAAVRSLVAGIGPEPNLAIRLAEAYALGAIGESLRALAAYDAVLDRDPGHRAALRGKALVLRSMLLPTQALALATAHPGILTEVEIERLEADEAAIRLRLTARTPYPSESIDEQRQRAVALIEEALAAASTTAARDTLLLDRVVALSDANRAEAAIAQFEALPSSADRDQPYVLAAAARAYLQAEQPETAFRLLQRALELDPDHLEVRFALVYAWLDLDRHDEAFALATALTRELPMANQAVGSNVVKGNEDRLRAELVAGIADAYGDQLAAAQRRFETLLERAPNNAALRQELANVYRWRGWLDRSLAEYRQILTIDDDSLGAQLGHAHAELDARAYAGVEQTVATVADAYASEPAVSRLVERWKIHNERELVVTASSGDSAGPVAGSNNRSLDVRWYTAPIAYRYRVFVTTHDALAEFPEGEARRRRIGAGLELRLPRLTVTGQISDARRGGEPGVAGTADYRLGDLWAVGGGIERDSDAVQLRADRLGIDADRLFVGARFTPSELASVGFGYDRSEYSAAGTVAAANSIESVFADGRRRLINRPRSKLDATGSLALGSAATSAVPYFSPTRDRTLMAGLEYRLRLHRRYDRELNQTLRVGSGRYSQRGYSTGSVWSLSWRVDWSVGERHAVGFEAARLGQVFDGVREHSTVGSLTVNSRF